jgi:hypothetical protein
MMGSIYEVIISLKLLQVNEPVLVGARMDIPLFSVGVRYVYRKQSTTPVLERNECGHSCCRLFYPAVSEMVVMIFNTKVLADVKERKLLTG